MWDSIQQLAIDKCLTFDHRHRFVAITGQAGTGKTSIIKTIYQECLKRGHRTAVCAPTGKAAKRLIELVGAPATTIHRLLRFGEPPIDPKTGKPIDDSYPGHHCDNPIPFDVVLVDECAMVGEGLYRYLIDALPRGGFLRAFGDLNQLPPIDRSAGSSPFKALLDGHPSVTLTTVHRNQITNSIPIGAGLILKGRIPWSLPDWHFHYNLYTLKPLKALVESNPGAWRSLDYQLISAMRETRTGSISLSQMVQDMVNPTRPLESLKLPRRKYEQHNVIRVSPGDKIIWTKNDYTLNILNGETGIILDLTGEEIEIDFGDRKLLVPYTAVRYQAARRMPEYYCPWENIELAYVITTHKAQGSEWKEAVYFVDRGAASMQTRANVYTAVTRAKEAIHVVGDQGSFQRAVALIKRPAREAVGK